MNISYDKKVLNNSSIKYGTVNTIVSKIPLFPKTNVLYIWAVIGIGLVFLAFLWLVLDLAIGAVFGFQQSVFPEAMADVGVQFNMALWHYFPPLALFGLGVWAFVKAQKDVQEQRY